MNVAVIGGGSWGTALAAHLGRLSHTVRLWVRDPQRAREIGERHENTRYLPGIVLPPLLATGDLQEAVAGAEMVAVVVPSEFCRKVYRALRPALPAGALLVSATKGLEIDTRRRMSEVAAEEAAGHPLAVLSGPSFALEVAQGQPTTVVVASSDLAMAEGVQRALSSRAFRAYSSDDVVGVELGGALKNVIAIAAGIADGMGFGDNAKASLMTRGLAELARLGVAMGGNALTFAGLAGMGDLIATCMSPLSRNRTLGEQLGAGKTLDEILGATRTVAEGVGTAFTVHELAERHNMEMPVCREVYRVLNGEIPASEAYRGLRIQAGHEREPG